MAIRTDQYTNSLTVVDTVTANAPLNLIPQGTAAVNIPGTGQNLITYSEQFQQANWFKALCTVTADTSIAPNGTLTADTLASTSAGDVFLEQGTAVQGPVCYSFFAKQGGASPSAEATLRMITFAPVILDTTLYFDFATRTFTGATGSVTSYGYVDVGNGWFRIYATMAATPGQTSVALRIRATPVAGSSMLIWGAQVEASGYVGPYVQTTGSSVYGTPTLQLAGLAGIGLQTDGSLYASAVGNGNIRLYTNNVGQEQFRVSHTASAVNFLQATGGTVGTTNATLSAQGSDSSVGITLAMKNVGSLAVTGAGGTHLLVSPVYTTGPAVNYLRVRGGPAGNAAILDVQGNEVNAALALQSKGTGGIDLAAGSSGVNISNGGTVTAITRTVLGGYSSVPSVALTAPTTAGGVQATATCSVQTTSATIAGGGTGYTVGDTLTLVGGTPVSSAGTFRVASVSGGVITAVDTPSFSAYTATPTNPVSVTGGTGSGATLNVSYFVGAFTITNAGSGYVEQPTVTFSGGGGSGAAAYATVGSTPIVRGLGSNLDVYTPAGINFRFGDAGATPVDFIQATSTSFSRPSLVARPVSGSGTINFALSSFGVGSIQFNTNNLSQEQMRVSHTASAVNYVQATGGATGSFPSITAQGSDTNIDFVIRAKGSFSTYIGNSNGYGITAYAPASTVNYFQTAGSPTGSGITLSAQGADSNIQIYYASKGTNPHSFLNGAGNEQFRVASTASAVNYVQVTGASTGNSPTISAQGSDAGINFILATKGSGDFVVSANSGYQFVVGGAASVVNYVRVAGGATGTAPIIQTLGSDTNIPLVLQPKGTGALQAQQTDSTATGGNARGINAVDWQTSRDTAAKVASGQYSVIGGGLSNINNSTAGVIAGGAGNQVGGTYAGVLSGISNIATGFGSAIGAGYTNTAAGFFNFIGGGFTNSGTSNSPVTSQSGTMNGTTAVTLSASNASIKVGQLVIGTSITTFPHTYVAAISGTSLTLSQAASGSSTSTLSFYTPHGVVVGGGNNTATGSYSFIGGGGDAGTAGNRNVASGDWSFVGGGRKNVASGAGSVVVGGGTDVNSVFNNVASATLSTIGGGWNNGASGTLATVSGGQSHQATGSFSSIVGGTDNFATGLFSAISGGSYGTTRTITGSQVSPACNIPIASTQGVSQAALLILGRQTTDATPTVLASNTSAATTTNQVILPNNSAYFFTGEVVAGVTGGGNTKGWTIEGVIKRGANAASTALVGTPTVTSTYADVGAATWTIAVTADTTNGGLAVTFTGQLATTIRCVAQIRTTEMTF
jgi:hypothetical protein